MRASRLLSILILLQLRVRLTAHALADEFQVSVRTIYRDIDELGAAGVPIYADRGPGGGFQLVDGYRTRLTGLATDEAEAMLMIGMPGPADALGLGAAASRATRKLLSALPATLSEGAGRLAARFHLDPVAWYDGSAPSDQLPVLARAVLDQRVVCMTYDSWSATREWRVDPLGLVLKAGDWYLVARSRKGIGVFRVAMILALQGVDATFERPADFDLARFWAASMRRFESGLRTQSALLRASATGRKRLARLGAYAARAVDAAEPVDADGWARLCLPYEDSDHGLLDLLRIGPEIEVLEPASLRDKLRQLAERIAARMR